MKAFLLLLIAVVCEAGTIEIRLDGVVDYVGRRGHGLYDKVKAGDLVSMVWRIDMNAQPYRLVEGSKVWFDDVPSSHNYVQATLVSQSMQQPFVGELKDYLPNFGDYYLNDGIGATSFKKYANHKETVQYTWVSSNSILGTQPTNAKIYASWYTFLDGRHYEFVEASMKLTSSSNFTKTQAIAAPTPEPHEWAMILVAIAGMSLWMKRRQLEKSA